MFSPCDLVLDILNNKPTNVVQVHVSPKMSISSLSHPRLSMRELPTDSRLLVVILVSVIVGIVLIGFVIYITIFKKRRPPFGPYEGTLVHPEDLAAQITPYGGSGPHRGRNVPRFSELIFYCDIYFRVFNDILQYILLERTCELLIEDPTALGTLPIH